MKHSIAFSGALIGLGIALLIDQSAMAAFVGAGFGTFLGYFFAGLVEAKKTLLKQGFAQLGNLRGRTLNDIVAVVGPYKVFQPCTITDMDNAPGFFYTWQERGYMIVLLFDANNICIGVSKEIDC